MPEVPVHFAVLDFEIGDRRLEVRVPVHQALIFVDQPFLVELNEHFQHRLREAFIHREPLARPIARGAQPAQLIKNHAAGFFLPAPHALEEFFATKRAAIFILAAFGKLAFDHHLRGDACVIHAGLPKHALAAQAFEADEHVLQRVVERVTDVERASYVRRRDHDAERVRLGVILGLECAAFFPGLGPMGFDLLWIERRLDHARAYSRAKGR